jgi:Glycosyl hydrolases family 2/Glycosyl hydrolases family 2, sugar binding domain
MTRALVLLSLLTTALLGQQRLSLAGTWQIRAEPAAADAAWREIAVPSAFETALGITFDGIARYRRQLPLPAQRCAAVRVEFAAVATQATVFCNGIECGTHLGGWTPFRVDVTAALRWDGTDTLEVLVDEKVGHNTQGFHPIIQPHFGGIWQDVTLCLDDGPVLDRLAILLHGRDKARLGFRLPVLATAATAERELTLHLDVRDGDRSLAATRLRTNGASGGAVTGTFAVADAQPWSPSKPQLYTVRVRLLDGEQELDRTEQRIGFRTLRAEGTRVLWNGHPLQLRGILHWGYSPPHLCPPSDPAFWRPQLEYWKACGFNTLKCCLWVPPRCVYELCDELGLCVWQEYPTWHSKLDQAHKQELRQEYAEFFGHDRNHPAVGFRSITCETGPDADLDVVTALWNDCKAAVGDSLVVDDSSWIGWQRITDFWDEHPYGNNSWFRGRLADFAAHQQQHGEKPLLLGECIAADTWVDRAAWQRAHGDAQHWWRPDCWTAQGVAEAWLVAQTDAPTLASLRPLSLEFGLRNRQFQIEQLRLHHPDAGYVVSVARDFAKARMGLHDDLDAPKWRADQFAWHGDTMFCLDLPHDGRALAGENAQVPVQLSHYGPEPLRGTVRLWSDAVQRDEVTFPIELQPGQVSRAFELPLAGVVERAGRVRVHAELTGDHAARSHWDLWRLPPAPMAARAPAVEIVDRLSPALLDRLERGGRAILLAGPQAGSVRTEALWFLKGAPFAPTHPLHSRLPADLLLELSSFDLESGRTVPWAPFADQVDPALAFWETHDIPEVRFHLLLAETRVGTGRLLLTSLRVDAGQALGNHVLAAFADHLQHGPAPRRALSSATLATMRAQLAEQRLELAVWRFRTDPDDRGRAAGWFRPDTDVSTADWRDLRAGAHWENQAEDLKPYTGIAWYRIDIDVPASWQDQAARAIFDGVDDSFELWLNGEPAGSFGDAATRTSIWLQRQVAELGNRLRPGVRNTLVLRVVDHAGAGGLWKPARLSTGPAGAPLLH